MPLNLQCDIDGIVVSSAKADTVFRYFVHV